MLVVTFNLQLQMIKFSQSAQSPANFILIPLKVNDKKEQRSIKIGSFGLIQS